MKKRVSEIFTKYYTRLVWEAILRSLFWGVLVGCGVIFVAAGIEWLVGYENVWLPIVIGVGIGLVCGVAVYFLHYRPDPVELARRLDRLGLDERMITMLELGKDDSYIAERQRSDAKIKLSEVSHKNLRFRFSTLVIVFAAVAFVLGGSMTTVVGLSASDIIPNASEIGKGERFNAYEVTYDTEGDGVILGNPDQLVAPGKDAEEVTASAEEGWMFVQWSDGLKRPTRKDLAISGNFYVIAEFAEIGEGGEGDESDNPNGENGDNADQEGDKADDLPTDGGANVEDGSSQDGQGSEGSGDSDSGSNDGATGEGDQQGDGKGDGKGDGAGGKWKDENKIINGDIYYRDQLEKYLEEAMAILAAGGEISDEMREFIETYYDGI